MTKKDFEVIAEIVAEIEVDRRYIANRLANYLGTRNPRFDRVRFLKACGETMTAMHVEKGWLPS